MTAAEQPRPLAARRLRDWILSRRMTYGTELELQDAIADRLAGEVRLGRPITDAGREINLDARNRIDFLVEVDGVPVGVEVKIHGSRADVVRQLTRYAAFPEIHELLLVTTKAIHHNIPTELGGKPVVLCSLVGAAL
ncbi:hypothetical protein ACF044_10705 [Microbacterium sp. NPDC016588]